MRDSFRAPGGGREKERHMPCLVRRVFMGLGVGLVSKALATQT